MSRKSVLITIVVLAASSILAARLVVGGGSSADIAGEIAPATAADVTVSVTDPDSDEAADQSSVEPTPPTLNDAPVSVAPSSTHVPESAAAGTAATTVGAESSQPTASTLDTPSVQIDLEITDPPAPIDPNCMLNRQLEVGDDHEQVACLESQLIAAGALLQSAPDTVFDPVTEAAVRRFQEDRGLAVDGMVGPDTAGELGVWRGLGVLPPDPSTCPATGRSAVVDRFNQRAWLCESGSITDEMPITTALSQPDPGEYQVYAKDANASSTISGDYSTMEYFVAFTYGKFQGARIAFHSIPKYRDGNYVQPLRSVGTQELWGASAGCIRVLPADAELIWRWLEIGDSVVVVT